MLDHRRRLPHVFDGYPIFAVVFRLTGPLRPNGPRWLQQREIAELFVNALLYGQSTGKYTLHAFVVMPTHVHLICEPNMPLPKITEWLKSRTARVANRMLKRSGPFWQEESYDFFGAAFLSPIAKKPQPTQNDGPRYA